MKIRWTDESVKDLQDIHAFIAKDSIHYADRQLERILSVEEQLVAFPESGRSVSEYKSPDVRELIIDKYRVIYRIKDDMIEILTVIHGARLL